MSRLIFVAAAVVVATAVGLLAVRSPGTSNIPALPAESPSRRAQQPRISILFGGDMMFDRSIRIAMEKEGVDFVFSCFDGTLQSADIAVANLEGPITEHASKSVGSAPGEAGNFTFTFSPSVAPLLSEHNIEIVNLGNNHILNFGKDGVRSTIDFLRRAGVEYFGDPLTHSILEKNVNGIPLTFVNYNEFDSTDPLRTTSVIENVVSARERGRIPIVYTHWGVEYSTTSPERIRVLAQQFVDAGAEIVIGSHPHVVGEREYYNGKYIYYSLGNMIFDQYWTESVRRGLLVRAEFDKSGVQYIEEMPIELGRDRRTCLLL